MLEIDAQRLELSLTQALKGDPQAFSDLVDLYQRPVFNLCYRMTGNAQDAEDAAQETFLRAYSNLRRYDRSRSFSTWLLSIAAHYCIDQGRKRRRPVVAIEELPDPDLPEQAPGLETQLSRKEERQRIQKILETLDPVDRAAVVMYYWYDYSYDEICQALDLSLSAVKSRLHRARRLMADTWQQGQPAGQPSGKKPASQSAPAPSQPDRTARSDRLLAERMLP